MGATRAARWRLAFVAIQLLAAGGFLLGTLGCVLASRSSAKLTLGYHLPPRSWLYLPANAAEFMAGGETDKVCVRLLLTDAFFVFFVCFVANWVLWCGIERLMDVCA